MVKQFLLLTSYYYYYYYALLLARTGERVDLLAEAAEDDSAHLVGVTWWAEAAEDDGAHRRVGLHLLRCAEGQLPQPVQHENGPHAWRNKG
eukprot:scaffold129733_cov69-Phaeocystis_antarctica.AAC.4